MTDEYANQVSRILNAASRPSAYRPRADEHVPLVIVDRRPVPSADTVTGIERTQLDAMFRGSDLDDVLANGFEGDGPINLEVARVVDASGRDHYRLWGLDFGGIYLMDASSLNVVAYASQHVVEHWSTAQRPVFFAMDHALQRSGHGFQQAHQWCWWDDDHWAVVATKPPGSMYSEAYIRKFFAGELAADSAAE